MSEPTLFERRMRDVVEAIAAWLATDFEGPTADEFLVRKGYTEARAEALLYRAARHDYIEFGVSARTGWLMAKGYRLLVDPRFGPAR